MSANGNDNGPSTFEAAERLRQIKRDHTQAELEELVRTGGGLDAEGAMGLREAMEVVGRFRAEDILGVEVREEDVGGEQATLAGEPRRGEVSESSAEPPPRGQTATLSGFTPEEQEETDDPGPLGDRLPADLEDVVGEQVSVTVDGTEHTLPNSVATWERVGNASKPEWRSQNVDGYDAVIVDQQAGGWRAIAGTAPRRDESLEDIEVVRPIGPFGEAAAAAVEFMRDNPDGRGQGNGSRPSSTRSR